MRAQYQCCVCDQQVPVRDVYKHPCGPPRTIEEILIMLKCPSCLGRLPRAKQFCSEICERRSIAEPETPPSHYDAQVTKALRAFGKAKPGRRAAATSQMHCALFDCRVDDWLPCVASTRFSVLSRALLNRCAEALRDALQDPCASTAGAIATTLTRIKAFFGVV